MNIIRSKLNTTTLLWLALALALLGSLTHLAAVFASVDNNIMLAWIQAIAIDAGLFALAYSLQQKRIQGRSVKWTMAGLALFTLISVYANLFYGLQATGALPPLLQLLAQIKPIVLAATLPILVLYLSELIASDKGHDDSVIALQDNLLELQDKLQDMQAKKLQAQEDIKQLQLQQDRLNREANKEDHKNAVAFGANEEQNGNSDNGSLVSDNGKGKREFNNGSSDSDNGSREYDYDNGSREYDNGSSRSNLDKANKTRQDIINERRAEVLQLLQTGMTQSEIANKLNVDPSTIARDKKALNGKVGSLAI